ncbi:MAG TPA: prealbumin-like fold domain-containing protein [Herpetosiphonaceae bacterium]|nr:prealbumin-like fold domain-containing protein [Herpetosiphonaceae bacterium]
MKVWPIIALALTVLAPARAQNLPRGTLTLLIRNPGGDRLAGVTVELIQDTDDQGRVSRGRYATDAHGEIRLANLEWGMYIVQFSGTAPDGRPIQPAERQNMGLLDDGNGISNGFGLRFDAAERTDLFVLDSTAATAIPMFDLAPGPDAPPRPFDPVAASQPAEPTAYTLRDVVEGRVDAQGRPVRKADTLVLALVGGLIWGMAMLAGLGYARSRNARSNAEKEQDHV